jgi:hypothetical protein
MDLSNLSADDVSSYAKGVNLKCTHTSSMWIFQSCHTALSSAIQTSRHATAIDHSSTVVAAEVAKSARQYSESSAFSARSLQTMTEWPM